MTWAAKTTVPEPAALVVGDEASIRAMDGLRRIVHALHVAAGASQRAFGVGSAQLFVLRQLDREPGVTMLRLAGLTRTTHSSVSEVVARLIDRDFISRRASLEDRRRAELTLTDAGRALLSRAPETVQERLAAGLERLTVEQRQALADGLDMWLHASGLDQVAATLFFEMPRNATDAEDPLSLS